MTKRSVWLGARREGTVRWLDAVEDSDWHDDLRAQLAKLLARRGLDRVVRALLEARIVEASSKEGKAAAKGIAERLRRDWTIAEPITATSRAVELPHHALLVDADARQAHLYRRDVKPRPGLSVPEAPRLPAAAALPTNVSLVASIECGADGADGADGVAALAALAEQVIDGPYKACAWESAWLAARADPQQRARLESSWTTALLRKPEKGAKGEPGAFVDSVLAARAKWAKPRPELLVRDASPDDLRLLATLNSRAVFLEMAQRRLPDDLCARLAALDDEDVLVRLARNESVPPRLLDELWQRTASERVKDAIVENNAAAPLAIFERIAARDDDEQAQLRAATWTTDAAAQRLFAGHANARVRLALAESARAYGDVLERLRADGDAGVRAAADAHPLSLMERAVGAVDDGVVERIAALPDASVHLLPPLALHADARVRLGVARHPRCTPDVQTLLVIGAGILGHAQPARPTRAIVRAVAAHAGKLDLAVIAAIVESGDAPAIETLVGRADAPAPLQAWRTQRKLDVRERREAANAAWEPFDGRLAGALWSRDDDVETREIAAERARYAFTPIVFTE